MEEKEVALTLGTDLMGWEPIFSIGAGRYMFRCPHPHDPNLYRDIPFNPFENIADAWQVLKRLEAAGWEWEMKAANYLHPSIKLTHGVTLRKVFAHGDDEAKTICNAAMKVVA